MLTASLGVIAALAFVLGLGALMVWGLKRFGAARLSAGSRVPIEIVQRVAMGPKNGLAVVRIGEKVMAVSIGTDGIRPLFELDEADRQHVIATSQVPTPFASSGDASKAFAKFLPGSLGKAAREAAAKSPTAIERPVVAAFDTAVQSARENIRDVPREVSPEIPSFITMRNGQPAAYDRAASKPASTPADRDFRDMLGVAMSGATRLAVFVGLIVLGAASSNLRAQTPPVAPPVAPPVNAAVTAATSATSTAPITPIITNTNTATNSAAVQVPAVTTPAAPTVSPKNTAAKPATPAKTAESSLQAGARKSVSANGINTSTMNMQLPAVNGPAVPNGRVAAAPTAPVAGGDDALAKFVPQMDIKLGDNKDGGLHLNGTVGIVVMMGLLTLLPTLLLMMTGFTRILIVLHFLKQAMGTQAAPPAQLLAAMALLLTGFVMAPTLTEVNRTAVEPWMAGKITQVEMLKTGIQPMREFMLRQTRESDIKVFVEMSKLPRPNTADDVPLHVLMSAFVASELRTAFQIGFAVYLPFIVIDAVVASVLMSMGMFMLPPAMISLPFKLLLFVLVDGWSLTIQSLVQSFK